MNRREFGKSVLVGSFVLAARASDSEVILYFVDGYHGGVRGHMPAGAWRDIVTRLNSTPDWKLCLDIEAASWRVLAERDPQSYAQISEYVKQVGSAWPRVEMVGGTFSQPYGWAMTGESNIRQLVRGLEVIRESFPGLKVKTYAMQEPCWASCLPQILVSLGFEAAVLKDPSTAWGGYSAGIDAETVNWIGPDGTSIRTVPRYACEELVDTWRTEAQTGSEAFAEKCVAHGIAHPAGMCFQDLGWAARPNVAGQHIRFVTWREYMESIAAKTTRNWRFSIEDIRCALPWGEQTLQKIAQQVRSAENKMIAAEKIASMAAIRSGQQYPSKELQEAWDKTLWAQHHDAWITATTRKGQDAWAFQVAAETYDADALCNQIIERALDGLVRQNGLRTNGFTGGNALHVFNTLGHDRSDLVEIDLATDIGTKSIRVIDSSGKEVTSQVATTRKYVSDRADRVRGSNHSSELMAGESIGAAQVLFRCTIPATGQATYRMETSTEPGKASSGTGVTADKSDDGTVRIESDLYKIRIDTGRGGVFSSLYAKALTKEFCGPGDRCFHEFRGYFIEEKAWHSSTDNPAAIEIIEQGPVRVTISITGKISSVPFQTKISVTQGQPRIDFHTQFNFEKETWIGDPWEIAAADRMTGRRRSEYDDRYKLLALFPVQFEKQAIYKNSAFDVCRSSNIDTFFNSWDAIKHNIILNWVDLVDEKEDVGLGLLTGHTTSYGHGEDHPLSLVLGWGWDGGFWWGKRPLRGFQEAQYAIVPHAGKWDKAALWNETAKWSEPLLSRLTAGSQETVHSLVRIASPGVKLSAMTINDRDLLVRLFNAESDQNEHEVSIGVAKASIQLVELDGSRGRALAASANGAAGQTVRVSLPRFGVRTLRVLNALS
jgi:alpha-mannosidase